ncbi:MAG TPA: hypothetical protein VLQ91_22480 [Draconibacterium sp.]|nr:hypothetical protein [Draconibacterium sp.]
MKRLLLISAFVALSCTAFSQGFKQAVGIRAGYTGGIEYRIYTDDLNSYKFLLGSRDRGVLIHAMKEFHRYELFSFTDQLNFVFGAGVHMGYERWDQQYYNYNTSYYVTHTAFIAGIDGLAGLEYMFRDVPISLGLEVKPYFDLFGREMFDFQLFDFAFTAKYHF